MTPNMAEEHSTSQASDPPMPNRAIRALRRVRAGLSYVLGARNAFGIADLDYDMYWEARGVHGVVARFPIIAHFLEHGESLLDIGCGEGTGLAYLTEHAGI